MSADVSRKILRYETPRRWAHWIGAMTFLVLLFSGVAPIVYTLLKPNTVKELLTESFSYGREDWEWFKKMPGYFFGKTKNLPPQGRINAGQKLHHAVTFLSFVIVTTSGFA